MLISAAYPRYEPDILPAATTLLHRGCVCLHISSQDLLQGDENRDDDSELNQNTM